MLYDGLSVHLPKTKQTILIADLSAENTLARARCDSYGTPTKRSLAAIVGPRLITSGWGVRMRTGV